MSPSCFRWPKLSADHAICVVVVVDGIGEGATGVLADVVSPAAVAVASGVGDGCCGEYCY